MHLTDLMPLEKWVEFEKEIHEIFGVSAAVFDPEGARITDYENWCNAICPMIRKNDASRGAICAVANQGFIAEARETGEPVIDECDAALVKICAPIYAKGEFLGVVGGCGRLPEGGEPEEFFIAKSSGLSEERVSEACAGIEEMSDERQQALAEFLASRIAEITASVAA